MIEGERFGIRWWLMIVLGFGLVIHGWAARAEQQVEVWECGRILGPAFGVHVLLNGDFKTGEGVVRVHGRSSVGKFVLRGLHLEWRFGEDSNLLFAIGPDGTGRYYDFSGVEAGERIPPEEVFLCKKAKGSNAGGKLFGDDGRQPAKAVPPPRRKPKLPAKAFDRLLSELELERQRGPVTALVRQIRERVRPCWNPPIGIKDAHKIQVGVRIALNTDGTLIGRPRIVDQRRLAADPVFRAYAESAVRALQNPRCSPLRLPLESYDAWRAISFTFDTRELLQ